MIRALGIIVFFLVSFMPPEEAIARRAPKPRGVLLDQSGVLTSQDIRMLRSGIESLEKTYNAKLGLLIVPSLHDDVLEKFAEKVARRWQFDEHLDGVLVVVSMREREFYLESFGKVRRAVNTRTLKAIQTLIFQTSPASEFGVSTAAWLDVFDGLCAEAFIPEIRLGKGVLEPNPERPWTRWLDLPLLLLAVFWLIVRVKRVRMGSFVIRMSIRDGRASIGRVRSAEERRATVVLVVGEGVHRGGDRARSWESSNGASSV